MSDRDVWRELATALGHKDVRFPDSGKIVKDLKKMVTQVAQCTEILMKRGG